MISWGVRGINTFCPSILTKFGGSSITEGKNRFFINFYNTRVVRNEAFWVKKEGMIPCDPMSVLVVQINIICNVMI